MRPFHWLALPWLVVALLVVACSTSEPRHMNGGHSLDTKHHAPDTATPNMKAQALADGMVEDIMVANACKYQAPGCDPQAIERARATGDKWKADTHCTIQDIYLGATHEGAPGNLIAAAKERVRGLARGTTGAAVAVVQVPQGVVLLLPLHGEAVRATFFGILVVVDCAPLPMPGLGDVGATTDTGEQA